jgi:hypothetical protein
MRPGANGAAVEQRAVLLRITFEALLLFDVRDGPPYRLLHVG